VPHPALARWLQHAGGGRLTELDSLSRRNFYNPFLPRCFQSHICECSNINSFNLKVNMSKNFEAFTRHNYKLFIGKSLKDSGKGWHVCDQALNALGCCTTTTSHVTRQSLSMNFWQKKTFLWFLSPPIRRISVPVTSFYSPGSKTT